LRYLFGDSTESDLEFDYLAFIREVIDCAVVMAKCEVALATTTEGRRTRERETASVVASIDELGQRAAQLVEPVAGAQGSTPVGRCAAAIAAAIRDAVDKESALAGAALATDCDELDRQDQRQRGRAKDVLEKLLRTHDLPGADKVLEVAWTASGVKATLSQRTAFGVEAVLSLDVPASSIFVIDLRVDRIAENVEVHAHETAGWLKKSDKLVAQKLGRYQVAGVVVGSDVTTVRLRATPEANAIGFVVTSRRNGDLSVEPTGGGPSREIALDDRGRPGLRLLAERLEAAARALTENRTGLVSVELDGTPIAQHDHPRVLAERLIAAIAPTVQKIARHSRSPDELVLRRLIGDNRREEIFASTADLMKPLDGLPPHARELFAALQLGGAPAKPPADEPTPSARPAVEAATAERIVPPADRRFDNEPEPRPDARPPARRTAPPPVLMSDPRIGPSRLSPPTPAVDGKPVIRPAPVRAESTVVDPSVFEDQETVLVPRAEVTALLAETHHPASGALTPEASRHRNDAVLGDAIDRALDEADSPPPPK